jgi:hypothetical protein
MKNILFELIADMGENLIFGLQVIFTFFIDIQTNIADSLVTFVANVFKLSLWLVNRDRVGHAEMVIDQKSLNNELEILMSVTKVKEDALFNKSWTTNHSLALNELSTKLYHECEWDKDRIHDYMRAIVESIPGLSYMAADSDDEMEDDEPIDLDD